jgi:hypothetical protein
MLKRPDQIVRLGKPAGMGYSSVKAPPVPPVAVKKTVAQAVKSAATNKDEGEPMVDLD